MLRTVLLHVLVAISTVAGMIVLFYTVLFVLVFLGVLKLDVGAGAP